MPSFKLVEMAFCCGRRGSSDSDSICWGKMALWRYFGFVEIF